jgi:nitrogenase-associated protein
MATVTFYEKPGCAGNARQRAWLAAAGHELVVRDLLREPWTRDSLLAFLAPLPVAAWFNRAAPKVKSGAVVPEALGRNAALALLLAEPLLIRRPLLEAGGRREVGFDPRVIHTWVGLPADVAGEGPQEGCRAAPRANCAPAAAASGDAS